MLRFRLSANVTAQTYSLAQMRNMEVFATVRGLLADAMMANKGPQLQIAIAEHFHIPSIDVILPSESYPIASDIATWLLHNSLDLRLALSIPHTTDDDDDDEEDEDDDWESDDWEEDDDEWDDDDEDDWDEDDDEDDYDPRTKWLN